MRYRLLRPTGLIPVPLGACYDGRTPEMWWPFRNCRHSLEPGAEVRSFLRAWPPDQRIAMHGARTSGRAGALGASQQFLVDKAPCALLLQPCPTPGRKTPR
jgi:hypothetical protein